MLVGVNHPFHSFDACTLPTPREIVGVDGQRALCNCTCGVLILIFFPTRQLLDANLSKIITVAVTVTDTTVNIRGALPIALMGLHYCLNKSPSPKVHLHTHTTADFFGQNSFSPDMGAEKAEFSPLDRPSSCSVVVACYRRQCLEKGDKCAWLPFPELCSTPCATAHNTADLFGKNSFSQYGSGESRGLATGWTETLLAFRSC